MDRDKLKLMVRNLELLVDDIKAEVFSDVESYVAPPPSISQDYDEILEDDDGYPCLLYTSPSPRDPKTSRMPSSA